ncbi:MAG: hypothetical protein J4F41_08150 [Alphaproteobacteria bacterium]|nr:hypothetical protein [Alphaproteobacteria bacterium]
MSDDDTNFTPQINYELLVESALRTVVRSSLKIAEQNGLPGNAHFYITFLTEYPGVNIPKRLKDSHPERMTIILQHQFWDLDVRKDDFTVSLSFGGKRETLTVPFMAVIDFNDPSVGFGLQFALESNDDDDVIDEGETLPEGVDVTTEKAAPVSADVVSLDTFRKKT